MREFVNNIIYVLIGVIMIMVAWYFYNLDSHWLFRIVMIPLGYLGVVMLLLPLDNIRWLKWPMFIISLPVQIFVLLFVFLKPILASVLSIVSSVLFVGIICVPLRLTHVITAELYVYLLLSLTSMIATTPLFHKRIQRRIDKIFNRSSNNLATPFKHDIKNVRFLIFIIYFLLISYNYIMKYSGIELTVDEIILSAFVTFIAYDRIIQNSSRIDNMWISILNDINVIAKRSDNTDKTPENNNQANE